MAGNSKGSDGVRPTDRAGRAAQTHLNILGAAGRLFEAHGYACTSIASIAREARVSAETIYKTFGTKRQVLQELIETSVVGHAATGSLAVLESESFRAVRAEPDQRRRLVMLAHLTRSILERAGPVHAVIRSAAATDPAMAALRLEQQELRLRGQTQFVRAVADAGPLRPGLTVEEGGRQYWILAAPEVHHILVAEVGWSHDQYEAWLRTSLELTLLPPDAAG